MKHRIIVLGAGYTGAVAAGRLARRLRPEDVAITLVNAEPDFVERVRMHQLAVGQDLRTRPFSEMFADTGVELKLAKVTGVDVDSRTVTVDGATGAQELAYDTLVYALGSGWNTQGVPGISEHAHDGRTVATGQTTISTSSGFSGRGTFTYVNNGQIEVFRLNHMLSNDAGDRIRPKTTIVFDLSTGTARVERFDLTCVRS